MIFFVNGDTFSSSLHPS